MRICLLRYEFPWSLPFNTLLPFLSYLLQQFLLNVYSLLGIVLDSVSLDFCMFFLFQVEQIMSFRLNISACLQSMTPEVREN